VESGRDTHDIIVEVCGTAVVPRLPELGSWVRVGSPDAGVYHLCAVALAMGICGKFSRVGRFIKREMCHEALFSAIVVLKNRFCTLVVCFRISESCDSHCRLSFCDTLVVDGASTRSVRLWLFEL
jgi:hypothetical protein